MSTQESRLPLARKQNLIVKELENEVMVYDSKRNKAFCLNQTSGIVWKSCDGKTTVSDMTRALRSIDSSVSDTVVWFALRQLETDGLLEQNVSAPAETVGLTRKELVMKFGLAAAMVPLVAVLAAPAAAKVWSGPPPA